MLNGQLRPTLPSLPSSTPPPSFHTPSSSLSASIPPLDSITFRVPQLLVMNFPVEADGPQTPRAFSAEGTTLCHRLNALALSETGHKYCGGTDPVHLYAILSPSWTAKTGMEELAEFT